MTGGRLLPEALPTLSHRAPRVTNAPEVEVAYPTTSDLWAARGERTIKAAGDLKGVYDPEDERVFNGDALNCRGWLTYRKAGQAGLVFVDPGSTGNADDCWNDEDHKDDIAYRKSLEEGQARG